MTATTIANELKTLRELHQCVLAEEKLRNESGANVKGFTKSNEEEWESAGSGVP